MGIGRLGTVLKVIDLEVEIEVALRVVHPALIPDIEVGRKFLTGMRRNLELKHEGHTRFFDVNCDGDRYFVVSQMLDGIVLSDLMESRRVRGAAFLVEEVLPVVEQIVEVLSFDGDIVHGALSPNKIWIPSQHLKVVDTGLVRFLPSAAVWHRLHRDGRYKWYVAPELCKGVVPDARADVFGLGALMGELLTQVAFDGRVDSFREAAPELPDAMHSLLGSALAVEPEHRYDDTRALLAALYDITGRPRTSIVPADTTQVERNPFLEETGDGGDLEAGTIEGEAPVEATVQVSMEDIIRQHQSVHAYVDKVADAATVSEEIEGSQDQQTEPRRDESTPKKDVVDREMRVRPSVPPPARQRKKTPVGSPREKAVPLETLQTASRAVDTRALGASGESTKPGFLKPTKRGEAVPEVPAVQMVKKAPVVDVSRPPTPASGQGQLSPRRPAALPRNSRPPVAPPRASRADEPMQERTEDTQEISLDDLEAVDNGSSPDRREVTQEIDLEMIEEMESAQQAGQAAEKLEAQAAAAQRASTEELIKRARRLDGVDPRFIRAAYSIDSDRRGGRSQKAAELLRQRGEDLGDINPRFLRAAARLEEARVSDGNDQRVVDEETPDEVAASEKEEDWRRQLEESSSDSVISFLAPAVMEKSSEVRGFPENQRRKGRDRGYLPPLPVRGRPAPATRPKPRNREPSASSSRALYDDSGETDEDSQPTIQLRYSRTLLNTAEGGGSSVSRRFERALPVVIGLLFAGMATLLIAAFELYASG